MKLTLLSADDLRRALPMERAIEATRAAFDRLSAGTAVAPQRMSVAVPPAGGTLLVKPAYIPGSGLGAKLVTVFPGNAARDRPIVAGLVVLLDPDTGEPKALCDGGFLTAWRTGAASGLATDLLARPDATTAALFGCGVQARTQLLAVCAVRPLTRVRVYARDPAHRERFVQEMQPEVNAALCEADSPAAALREADIVCAATTSATPVFDGRSLATGAHVNGVGSFTAAMQELDVATVARAAVFVDAVEAALAEAGDLIQARDAGQTRPGDWAEIGDVAGGRHPGRRSRDEVTLFKSVGVAVQDVATFATALDEARRLGLGTGVEF